MTFTASLYSNRLNKLFSFLEQTDLNSLKKNAILRLIKNRFSFLERESSKRFLAPFYNVCEVINPAQYKDFSGDIVRIGRENEIDMEEKEFLFGELKKLMPWRKGPFSVFGIEIDAEWRSYRKWNRIKPFLPDLEGKVVCDVGCNNGYYMFKMAELNPAFVLGIDPTVQYFSQFSLLNHIAGVDFLNFQLIGVEQIDLFEQVFDVVFLMGIIYHHPSPVDILKKVRVSMKPGGTLIVESQGIEGELPVALFPEKRYAKVPGTYFVPTPSCLKNFLKRAGFKEIDVFYKHKMSSKEQRRTEWMLYESYSDFVNEDNTLTVEGYPAPIRIYAIARS